ncbi:MAG: GT4 family glycosyltransferase PelF, partial [Myxococcales bacterium]|nr:GT4 family glycosyltransferase PelF [Myxococcales bacterium]
AKLHQFFRAPESGFAPDLMRRIVAGFGSSDGIARGDFLYSEESWRRVCADYAERCTDPSFVDYFWTVRTMHAPLFVLADVARTLGAYRAFHSVSTGYAGFLGTLLHHRTGRPLVLSEHGIYTKERKIDLAQADWIRDAREIFGGGLDDDVSYIRRLWIRFFEGIGRLTYDAADVIVGLYDGVRTRQIEDGAPPARTRIVPNGIDVGRLAPLRARRPARVPPVVAFIGRVVPIKDIRTFIRAMRTICSRRPDAEGWIVGPDDEDAEYARECRDLAGSLGLADRVRFFGQRRIEEILPQVGLVMLTSISEALPLVLLEAFASGVPAVATDVGSCRELIEGASDADRALGSAGALVPIADPERAADAALALLTDEPRWRAAQAAAMRRVETYYTEAQMFASYRDIYRSVLDR